MREKKGILCIVGTVLAIAAACAVIYTFREEIRDFVAALKEKCCGKASCCCCKEADDFADLADEEE